MRTMKWKRVGLSMVAWTSLLACQAGVESRNEADYSQQHNAITDGEDTADYPSVGLVIGSARCTGTLVGAKTVVTAAHCIQPGAPFTFHLGKKIYAAEKAVFYPGFVSGNSGEGDIAILLLETAAEVTPSRISYTAPYEGLEVTFVGFGISSENATDFGKKRAAKNTINLPVEDKRFSVAGTGGGVGNVCKGDSGGPVFASLGGVEVVIGIVSGGEPPCGTKADFTRVDVFTDWLEQESGNDLYQGASASKLKVSISHPENQANVGKQIFWSADIQDDTDSAEAEFYIDCELVANVSRAPFYIQVALSEGEHLLAVVAHNSAAQKSEVGIQVFSNGQDEGDEDQPQSQSVVSSGCSTAGTEFSALALLLGVIWWIGSRRRNLRLVLFLFCGLTFSLWFAGCDKGQKSFQSIGQELMPSACLEQNQDHPAPTGVCAPSCTKDSDCGQRWYYEYPSDYKCQEGRCTACVQDADCTVEATMPDPTGQGIDMTIHIKLGTGACDAERGACIKCETDDQCSDPMKFGYTPFAYCINGGCGECKSDEECFTFPFKGCDTQTGLCNRCTDDTQCCAGKADCALKCNLGSGACECSSGAQCSTMGTESSWTCQ